MIQSKLGPLPTAKIIYIIGGPGSGKGAQCSRLARDLNLVHVSMGNLLRAEQCQPSSVLADAIREHYHYGKPLSDDIYALVLQEHLVMQINNGKKNFIVTGFPRNIYQAGCTERHNYFKIKAVLFLWCSEQVMLKRVLHRARTKPGRADDNETTFNEQYKTFKNLAGSVLNFYRGAGKLTQIDSSRPVEAVYSQVRPLVESFFRPIEGKSSAN